MRIALGLLVLLVGCADQPQVAGPPLDDMTILMCGSSPGPSDWSGDRWRRCAEQAQVIGRIAKARTDAHASYCTSTNPTDAGYNACMMGYIRETQRSLDASLRRDTLSCTAVDPFSFECD